MHVYAHQKLFIALVTAATFGTTYGMYKITIPSYDNTTITPQSPTLNLDFERRVIGLQKELDNNSKAKSSKEASALIRGITAARNATQFQEEILSQLATKKGIDLWRTKGRSLNQQERSEFIALYAKNQPKSKQLLLSLIIENPVKTLAHFGNNNSFSILADLYHSVDNQKS
ncbi:hypothetical protein KJZ61_00945 [Candidatus Dependentiae bacterium]|nr:hypothetical protein [Candidatus Dependentiae bacterium]